MIRIKNGILAIKNGGGMHQAFFLFPCFILLFLLTGCAKMGQPDGGWYDETPPRVIGASPADKGVDVKSKTVNIYFDEYIKIDNPTENVIVSPPQMEAPEIKGMGKRIKVELKDTLKPNSTYTIDFSDAISDNNEGNPLGNYTYSFSTGSVIDTMEVSGHVLAAENLEPVKGILVGLYDDLSDSAFHKKPFLRVARTDSRGHFVIKGVAPGQYRIYALQDADGNYLFNQKSEALAFDHQVIIPSSKPDIRQDTIWRDTLHIDSIARVSYTHFLPDDIVLRSFTEVQTNRYLVKTDRSEANHFTFFFSYGNPQLPQIKGLNFNAKDAFVIQTNAHCDTINYWLRDTALVNQDTLRMQVQYLMTDSMGVLQNHTDTLEMLAKKSYSQRLKEQQKAYDTWKKKQDKAEKKGEPFEKEMPKEQLAMDIAANEMNPDENVMFVFKTPIETVDTSKIHLYAKHDTLWYKAPFLLRAYRDIHAPTDTVIPLQHQLQYELIGEWRPGIEYSLETDSMAFVDIYGLVTSPQKKGFKVGDMDSYSSLLVSLLGMDGQPIVAQLLNGSDQVVKEAKGKNGTVEFYYLKPDTYYLRLFIDRNHNGIWDTGDYDKDIQPEEVYYYPGSIECKAKWDVTESWNPKATSLAKQKPEKITKQKADKEKKVKRQNAQRAKKLGIQYIPKN